MLSERLLGQRAIWMVVGVLLTAWLVPANAAGEPLQPVWAFPFEDWDGIPGSASVALSESGRCAAVAGKREVRVIDNSGRQLWQWHWGDTNRFITPGTLAVSASCTAVAMAGDANYRYTWIADRWGHRVSMRTRSTPISVAFDRTGQHVAIGTAGGDVLLVTRRGALKWKKSLGYVLCGRLAFSADNRFIAVRQSALLLSLEGNLVWNAGENEMEAARDLQTFLACSYPMHGPGFTSIAALDASGKRMWSKLAAGCGVISASGDTIAAAVLTDQPPADEFEEHPPRSLQVLSRSGATLQTLPVGDAEPIAISPDGKRLLIRTDTGIHVTDVSGNRLLEIPVRGNRYSDQIYVADDFSAVVVLDQKVLGWYSLPR